MHTDTDVKPRCAKIKIYMLSADIFGTLGTPYSRDCTYLSYFSENLHFFCIQG